MSRTIIVPIDLAAKETADDALALAQDLARTRKANLALLYVFEHIQPYVASQLPEGFHEKALADAAVMLREVAAAHGLDDAELVVRDGYPPTEILEYAKASGADMIVIGSHDPGPMDFFLGSVAARVVRHAHCSVLVVRNLAA